MDSRRGLLNDERAQASVEYVLLVLAALGFVLLLYKKILKPVFARLANVISSRMDQVFLKGDLHQLPFKR